ncbi:DUF1302 domain-containing protein [Burkholderia pyrrocinia]|uniref:DUF1302 domain-containing protein n=1 Tax=Burkholderia pyrrocinia TaxID=60550 RepID=UPI00201B8688|nr:DUF1302 family protein [Burkholderia pyrrocinia]
MRRAVIAAALGAMFNNVSWAGNTVQLGADTTLDYTVTASYGAALRTQNPSGNLLKPANINGDDGDRNFSKGSLTANRFSLLGEADLRHGAFGVFIRGNAFYDFAYHGTNDNNAPNTVNHSGPFNHFTSGAQYYNGQRAQLLDAYGYGTFNLGGTRLTVKAGNQVVAWGESLYFPNIAGAQGPVDATQSFVPGTEVKDILLPVPQVSTQWQITPNISLLAYYQFKFEPNQLNAAGSYFSFTDVVGPGAQFIIGPGGRHIPLGPDIRPSNSRQWGVGGRFRVGGDTEIGLYRLRYDDKNPNVVTTLFPSLMYQQKYFGGIDLTGASFSTQMYGANVAGEISYRQGAPVLVSVAGAAQTTRGNAIQGNLSAIYSIGPTFLAASQALSAEVSWVHVTNVTPLSGSTTLANTRDAAAYQIGWTLNYLNVFDGWDMAVPLNYANDFTGKSALGGALGSLTGVGDQRVSVGVTLTRLSNLQFGLTYAMFLGHANTVNRPLADRSYVAFNAKYSF